MEDYARQLLKRAVHRLAFASGAQGGVQQNALNALTDVCEELITSIGRDTARYAALGGRAVPHAGDAILAIESYRMPIPSLQRSLETIKKEARLSSQSSGKGKNGATEEDVSKVELVFDREDACEQIYFPKRSAISRDDDDRPPYVPLHLPPFPPRRVLGGLRVLERGKEESAPEELRGDGRMDVEDEDKDKDKDKDKDMDKDMDKDGGGGGDGQKGTEEVKQMEKAKRRKKEKDDFWAAQDKRREELSEIVKSIHALEDREHEIRGDAIKMKMLAGQANYELRRESRSGVDYLEQMKSQDASSWRSGNPYEQVLHVRRRESRRPSVAGRKRDRDRKGIGESELSSAWNVLRTSSTVDPHFPFEDAKKKERRKEFQRLKEMA